MKNFIGIDFSKEKFDAVIIAEGKKTTHHCSFPNNSKGADALLRWVHKQVGADKEKMQFCGEYTGVYSTPLADYLTANGYEIRLENPFVVSGYRGLNRDKNDKADAMLLADYGMRQWDKIAAYHTRSKAQADLRKIQSIRQNIVKMHTTIIQLQKCGDFSDLWHKDGEPEEKNKGTKDEKAWLNGSAIDFSRCNLGDALDKVNELLEAFKTSSEIVIKEINKAEREVIDNDPEMKANFDIVTSIPGIALQNAAALLVYTENFQKFDLDARKIACYYGVAVFGRQSGNSLHTGPHTSHLANKQLKALLSEAAVCAVRFCPDITKYYNHLIAMGKNRQTALNNCKNKLLHIIVAMVKHRQPYDKNYALNHKAAA